MFSEPFSRQTLLIPRRGILQLVPCCVQFLELLFTVIVDVYEVEKICDAKVVKNKTFYLVKWLGYPDSQNTWEPSSNILDKDPIENWKKTQQGVNKD